MGYGTGALPSRLDFKMARFVNSKYVFSVHGAYGKDPILDGESLGEVISKLTVLGYVPDLVGAGDPYSVKNWMRVSDETFGCLDFVEGCVEQ